MAHPQIPKNNFQTDKLGEIVATECGTTWEHTLSIKTKGKKAVARTRQFFAYFACTVLDKCTATHVGEVLGYVNHTSVLYSLNLVKTQLYDVKDQEFIKLFNSILDKVQEWEPLKKALPL